MRRPIPFVAASAALLLLSSIDGFAQGRGGRGTAAPAPPPGPARPLETAYLNFPLAPADQAYAAIDGKHLVDYVAEQAAISRKYRDAGHQWWGRIIGSEADQQNAEWLMGKLRAAGLSEVHQQSFDLPPQWWPQSWSVSASGGKTLNLETAQPPYRTEGTTGDGLDLEAVDVNLATDGDLANRDLKGKAVFFYSTDFFSRHATISGGAFKKIEDKGAAAIFVTLMIPGNLKFQFYPVNTRVPSFTLGYQDGMAMRDLINQSRGGAAPHVKIKLDVKMVPNLKTSTVWGTLPGMSDETIYVVAHRDGWFESANDNGTGVATMIGLAEYFAKIPKERRRRTIMFVGSTGHHDGTAETGTDLAAHKEQFAKTALIINSEHTAGNQMVLGNGTLSKSTQTSPFSWYVGGSPKLEEIAIKAYAAFGVPTLENAARTPAGEIGRIYQFAPAIQLIDTGYYWHSDHETVDMIPPTGLAASTRAYAKIMTEINALDLKDLQRPPAPTAR